MTTSSLQCKRLLHSINLIFIIHRPCVTESSFVRLHVLKCCTFANLPHVSSQGEYSVTQHFVSAIIGAAGTSLLVLESALKVLDTKQHAASAAVPALNFFACTVIIFMSSQWPKTTSISLTFDGDSATY